MLRRFCVFAIAVMFPALLFGNAPPVPVIGPDSQMPPVINPVPLTGNWMPPNMDYVGTIHLMGTTWYDYQHNGTTSRQIGVNDTGTVFCTWMKGMESGAANRNIFGNIYPGVDTVGVQINTNRSGYVTGDIEGNNWKVFYHSTIGATNQGVCAFDTTGTGTFRETFIPQGATQLTWPHGVIDHQGYVHVVAQPNPTATIHYSRSQDGGYTFSQAVPVPASTSMSSVAHTMAASPVSNKVAIIFIKPIATNYMEADVFYIQSNDGVTWNFNSAVNITNFGQPGHPMTNNVRAWTTANAIYDNNDNLHIAYSTLNYPSTTTNGGIIWHWSQATGHTQICGQLTFGGTVAYNNPGAWHLCWDLPCLGIDSNGILYCSWEQCTTPGDASAGGYGNWDVYVNCSRDNGATWSEGINVTDTHTPGAAPGQCMSEGWPTMARKVDDFAHILYIQDRDAGGIPQTEGTWTDNPVIYQRVPVAAILGELTVTLTPVATPIQIPAGGGSFTFDAQIVNNTSNPITFDAWTEVILPNGAVYGPLILRTSLPIPAGHTIIRTGIRQNVPAAAPSGNYTYVGKAGTHPTLVIDFDQFDFSKLAGEGAPNHNLGWTVSGWFDSEMIQTSPAGFELVGVHPNPFNPETEVSFTLNRDAMICLSIYDIAGREVAVIYDGFETTGQHTAKFSGAGLPSGVYFFTLKVGSEVQTLKSLLLK